MDIYKVIHARKLGNGISRVEGISVIDDAGLPVYPMNNFSHWVGPWYWPCTQSTVHESVVTGSLGYLVEDENRIHWICQGEKDED